MQWINIDEILLRKSCMWLSEILNTKMKITIELTDILGLLYKTVNYFQINHNRNKLFYC